MIFAYFSMAKQESTWEGSSRGSTGKACIARLSLEPALSKCLTGSRASDPPLRHTGRPQYHSRQAASKAGRDRPPAVHATDAFGLV